MTFLNKHVFISIHERRVFILVRNRPMGGRKVGRSLYYSRTDGVYWEIFITELKAKFI